MCGGEAICAHSGYQTVRYLGVLTFPGYLTTCWFSKLPLGNVVIIEGFQGSTQRGLIRKKDKSRDEEKGCTGSVMIGHWEGAKPFKMLNVTRVKEYTMHTFH